MRRTPTRPRASRAAVFALAAVCAACGSGDGAPAPIVPSRITFAATPDSALVGDTVALGATATDMSGRRATVGTLAYTSSDTTVARVSAAGVVRFVGPGTAVVTARVNGLPGGDSVARATPPLAVFVRPARVSALPLRVDAAPGVIVPLAAAVYDSGGNRIAFPVTYTSDNSGIASVARGATSTAGALTAGSVGSAQVTVSAQLHGRGATATIPVTVAPLAPGAFRIDLVPVGNVNPAYAAVFTQAAAFWQRVITAALPSATLDVPANTCDDNTPALSATTTGVTIFFRVDSIDGPGKVLGEAGPCVVRGDASGLQNGLTAVGSMVFDSADFNTLVARGVAYDVIRHEMGHVLGIGTLWRADLVGAGSTDPLFVGPQGESGSAVLGFTVGDAGVPVENVGGPGTADAHWRTSVFYSELMTGYLARTTTHPASRLTILSLADLGYSVNVAASEPLLPPSATAFVGARGPSPTRVPVDAFADAFTDVALPPLYRIAPGGALHRLEGVPPSAAALRTRTRRP